MERVVYRITLDTHRTGIQRTLQGFETADNMARRISVNLVASGDTYEIPIANVIAMMYVTTPSATEPSIHNCVIDGNTIIYDAEPIVEEGITEMQLKVIESDVNGAKKVLALPRFAVEVTKSNADDEKAEQSATFTALEDAIAKADALYDSRLLRIAIEEDFVFRAYYADGTVYENTYFVNVIKNGASMLAQSYAVGGVGVREGEDTDNAKYYSNVSRSASEDANKMYEESHELLDESRLYSSYTYFNVNFETGELGYISVNCDFKVNQETGNLDTNKDAAYSVDEIIASDVKRFVDEKSAEIDEDISENKTDISNLTDNLALTNVRIDTVEAIAKGATQAISFDTYKAMVETLAEMEATELNVGQNIYIGTGNVPDVWVYRVVEEWMDYSYIDEQTFADDFANLAIQVGYYVLLPLETEKVDLTEYAKSPDVYRTINALEDNVNENFLQKGDLAWLEGTATVTSSEFGTAEIQIPYPEGFTIDNSIVIGAMTKDVLFSTWRTVFYPLDNVSSKKSLNPTISLTDECIILSLAITSDYTKTFSYRVLLLRLVFG